MDGDIAIIVAAQPRRLSPIIVIAITALMDIMVRLQNLEWAHLVKTHNYLQLRNVEWALGMSKNTKWIILVRGVTGTTWNINFLY